MFFGPSARSDVASYVVISDNTKQARLPPKPGVFDEDSAVLDSPMWHLEAKFTCMWNLTGAPVLSLPCAFTSDGRPFAMQIVVPPNDEERLLRLGSVIESTLAIPRTALVPTWVRSVLGHEAV